VIATSIAALARSFREHADDPVRGLERCLAAVEAAREDRAILSLVPTARAEAEAAARRFAAGKPLGDLDGIPLAVKDCIDVAGVGSTNGRRSASETARHDATCVRRLRQAGAVVFAKTNMHELGILPFGINPHHGTPRNPWDPERMPGGSSSGSAVAVASGIAAAALGTDAGGSVRVPATLNGLVGLKPTFGAVPDDHVAKLTSDLDHIGPLAWTVDDAALVFETIADRKLDRAAVPGRVAVARDFFVGAENGVERVVREAVSAVFPGAPDVDTPMCRWAAPVEMVIVGVDASTAHGELLRSGADELGADARAILQLGAAITPEKRAKADAMRRAIRAELDALFRAHDLLLGPAVGCWAPRLHPDARRFGELDTNRMAQLAAVTFVANLSGLPACAVPCVREGLPMSLQIMGRAGEEARVLAAARLVEQRFGPRVPPRWFGHSVPGAASPPS
jgi:aspartyl-tRNA(Asn)/glutamyl-tRNA(Gln) amidotransferase subunit A